MLEQIGTVSVDAGLVWVGDPCYVFGDDASSPTKQWSDFCEAIDKAGIYEAGATHAAPYGAGVGFAIESGYGDGLYPVFIEKNREGRVTKIVVEFDSYDAEY